MWAYTPRGSAILWSRPGAEVTPTVLSWQLQDGYAPSFDYPGTWDYAGWLAAPDGLAHWETLGGWQSVARLAGPVTSNSGWRWPSRRQACSSPRRAAPVPVHGSLWGAATGFAEGLVVSDAEVLASYQHPH